MKNSFCIFRCKDAGLHAGELVTREDGVVIVKDSRRLWYWKSKATLSELSQFGPEKPQENKFGCVVPLIMLNELDVCEVIVCSEAARKAILAVPVWSAS